ncbi:MAG: TraB/GumN family protein [Alphaproteobacteria bacterium]|nr:MAG: TraB/GumN family protein [Alphaproteobacteria bacterium]
MLKRSLLAAAAFVVLSGSAFAQTQAIDPALFVVRDADSTMYLYGTVHVRPNGADWADAEVRAALAETQEIWTELLMTPETDAQTQQLALQMGRAAPGRPLSSWLSAEENAKLNALTGRLGMPPGALEGFQPWLAGLTLAIVPALQAGYNPASGVDRNVDAFGDANGRTMRALETVEQQLGFFTSLSEEAQRQFLVESINEAENGVALLNQMTAAWEQGDVALLEQLVITETRRDYPEVYRALFVDRNNAWMEVLTREMAGSGVDFVAVGAGHLIGEDGLVAQFRARGFTVERVE